MSHRNPVGLIIACAAALLTVAACTSEHADAKQSGRPTHASDSGSATITTPPSATRPPTQKPPTLDGGETLAGHQNVTGGSASIPFGKGRKSDALIVAVNCLGKGKIKVAVQSVHVSFPLDCVADKVNTAYNEMAIEGVARGGVVSVQAPSGVRWSMAIGRGAPAQEE
ncbi:hypothetical protein [Streptomyces sp. NPDC096324]|uniref:hypothetical protein n=1 Tax=Streptomyces sp. NPDC096324 TaxID=3366085 RepID=UPI0037F227EA